MVVKGYYRALGGASTSDGARATFNTTDRCDGTLTEVGKGRVTLAVKGRSRSSSRPAGPTWSRRSCSGAQGRRAPARWSRRTAASGVGGRSRSASAQRAQATARVGALKGMQRSRRAQRDQIRLARAIAARSRRPLPRCAVRRPDRELHAAPHGRAPLGRRRHALADVLRAHALLLRARPRAPASSTAPGRADASISRFASPTAIGAQASSSATSSPIAAPRRRRRGSPARSARRRRRRSRAPVMISSFARPTPTTCGSREEPPRSGTRPRRVSGSPTNASSDMHPQVAGQRELQRPAEADAVDLADGRLGHLLGEVPGLEAVAAERAQLLGARAAAAPAPRRPSRRRTPGRCRAGRRSARTGRRRPRAAPRPMASTSSSLNALRFSGRLRMTWRTASRSSVMTRSDTAVRLA